MWTCHVCPFTSNQCLLGYQYLWKKNEDTVECLFCIIIKEQIPIPHFLAIKSFKIGSVCVLMFSMPRECCHGSSLWPGRGFLCLPSFITVSLPVIESFSENLNENKCFSQDCFEILMEKEKTHKKCLAETHKQRGERDDSERQNTSKVSNNLSML